MSASGDSAVAFRGVGKRFDDWVFRGVDLALPAKRTSAIVGESGCGKTTLLQLVNAVLRPDEGSVEVLGGGVPDAGLEAFRRRIGYAVQGAGLFPHLTLVENVSLLARLERWEVDVVNARVGELFQLVGLTRDLDDRYPHELSGGQQHRAGLCRALMLKPDMLLLDEPFSAIDPITRVDIYGEFETLQGHERVTTVLVTHDIREARRLADYLVVMGGGGVVQAGEVDEVVSSPASDQVKRLLESGA
ncbi:MAG: ATP-binding cassette domain-containing protein [Gammaproteobacteria bacterium]|nr:ATP-binding cassette domain-containing protein [Gammaproteobacteria bacterium]